MITGIYIENFKGIGEPGVKLDLEPVTLLFGSNSAGKSTIFHAILLAYEVLVRGNRNPDKTELGGSVVDLGGFPCFVHQHEQQRNIRLRFELDLSSVSLDQEWRIDERVVDVDWVSVDADNIGSDVWSASVQIDLSWDESRRRPFVSKYIVELDEQQFAEIEDFRLVGGSVLLHVDPSHPVLRWSHKGPNDSIGVLDYFHHSFRTPAEELYLDAIPIVIPGLQSLLDDSSRPEVDEIEGTERPNTNDPVNMVTELESLAHLRQLGDLEVRRILHEDASGRAFEAFLYRIDGGRVGVVAVRFFGKDGWLPDEAAIAIQTWADEVGLNAGDVERKAHTLVLNSEDALPNWYLPLDIQFEPLATTEDDVDADQADLDFVSALLSRLLIVPGRTLMNALDACRYVGPLREIPSRQFVIPSTPDRSRWATGLAAWDVLAECSDETLTEISEWLAADKRLGTRHEIVRRKVRELPSDGLEMQRLEADDYLDEIERIRELIFSRPESVKVQLFDQMLNIRIDPHDCAIGIAQLVPVVVAGVTSQTNRDKPDQHGMFLIEQPELHNHPSVEVGLGDLFIETVHQKQCRFILETHGEHLMLRILRRIQETSENTLPEGVNGLLPTDVAVYFVERTPAGVTTKRINIDETGEFIDKWPYGFFRERAEELF